MSSDSPTAIESTADRDGQPARRGFTLAEISIAAFLFGLLLIGVLTVYRFSVDSYRTTVWKQERLLQAELFWNHLRKNLEEASNLIEIAGDLTVTPRPLLYRPQAGPGTDGPVLRWMRSRTGASGVPEYRIENLVLYAKAKILVQSAPGPGTVAPPGELVPSPREMMSDVSQFSVITTPIRLDPNRGEYLGPGPNEIVGSLVEISVRFRPPPGSGFPPSLEITQNHKFKLAVDSQPLAAPSAFPGFP